MARYLVTGGAGFIGSHVVDRLVAEGHQVRVLDDLSSGRLSNLAAARDRIEFLQGDIRDRELVATACRGVDVVIHEAAWRSVPKSMQDPSGYTEVNVLGTVNVLEASVRAGVTRVVCASSSSVYGETTTFPLREDQPPRPVSPYAASKWAMEVFCGLFARSCGIETVALRYFNVFGPRQRLDNEYAVVVPTFITCLLRGLSPPVYGDGTQTRDFTYIENVVEATLRAARQPGVSGEVFNIALGEEQSVLGLLEELNSLLRLSIPPRFEPPRAGDVQRTLADLSKAQRLLGWKGAVNFREGLRRTVEWFRPTTCLVSPSSVVYLPGGETGAAALGSAASGSSPAVGQPAGGGIPLIDLRAQYRSIKPEIDEAIQRVVASGQFILGPEVEALEREVAAYCGVRQAVAVASGTDALELSLRALGIGSGDEVLTSAYTFFATIEAILAVGAIPVCVDVDPSTCTCDPEALASHVSPKTRAILPVHLYGHPCQLDAILALARRHRLTVIEDCAQAIGARYRGRRIGSFGEAGALSFYPSKNLGGYGDGGMVVTDEDAVADQVRLLRAHGSREKYHHVAMGRNSRLDELQAAILRVKLRHLDRWNEERRRHAATYRELFARERLDGLRLPEGQPDCEPVYHLYTIRTPQRDRIKAALAEQGIASDVAYPWIVPAQPALVRLTIRGGPWPQAEAAAREVLALPMYPELTEELIERVVAVVSDAQKRGQSPLSVRS